MGLVVVLILSFVAFLLAQKLAKITKLEVQIIYIILGLVIGLILNKTSYGSIDTLLPKISMYNTIALLLMFFSAGFSIDLGKLKRSGKVTGKMFSMPAYGELIVTTAIIVAVGGFLKGQGFSLGFPEAVMVAAIFATSSPANVIPVCMGKISRKETGKNSLPSTMILSTVIDGFITVPVVFAAAFVFIKSKNDKHVTSGELIKLIIVILICLLAAMVIGAIIGKVETLIFRGIFTKMRDESYKKKTEYLVTAIVFIVGMIIILLLMQVNKLKSIINLFGILVVLGIGFGINKWDKTETRKIIGATSNKAVAMLGMPAIFIYVGANIDLAVLLNVKLLIVLLIITAVAVLVKGKIGKLILRDSKHSDVDRKFAARCFIPKGVGLSNFSVIFGNVLGPDEDVVQFMTMLAAVSIIVTMSIGIGLLNKTPLEKIEAKDEVH